MSNRIPAGVLLLVFAVATALPVSARAGEAAVEARVLTGRDALGDWTTDAPGVRRKITLEDLAKPYETRSANNFPSVVKRPQGAWPIAPPCRAVAGWLHCGVQTTY